MRTRFSDAQRSDPKIAASEAELRRCVRCGFCTSTCPTYVLEGNELDGPRGRIALIQDMLETDGPPAPGAVRHVDRCLSCLSCATGCPSGVDYRRLIDSARAHIETHYRRPWNARLMRALLGRVLPRPALFRLALGLGRLARPLAFLLPPALRPALALVPKRRVKVQPIRPGRYPAQGDVKLRVVLWPGCVQDALAPGINRATIRVLTKLGAEVVVPQQTVCCGALSHHMGDARQAQDFARRTLGVLPEDIDHIVVTAAGCGAHLKDYAHLLHETPALSARAGTVAARTLDVSELVEKLGLPQGLAPPQPLTLAYQSACALQHGQKIDALPQRLLTQAGYRVVAPLEAHLCCGSAGTYNLLEPDLAARLRARKAEALAKLDAAAVASGNIGCMTQLVPALSRPVAHTIEWLDWALGGPAPAGAERLSPRN